MAHRWQGFLFLGADWSKGAKNPNWRGGFFDAFSCRISSCFRRRRADSISWESSLSTVRVRLLCSSGNEVWCETNLKGEMLLRNKMRRKLTTGVSPQLTSYAKRRQLARNGGGSQALTESLIDNYHRQVVFLRYSAQSSSAEAFIMCWWWQELV